MVKAYLLHGQRLPTTWPTLTYYMAKAYLPTARPRLTYLLQGLSAYCKAYIPTTRLTYLLQGLPTYYKAYLPTARLTYLLQGQGLPTYFKAKAYLPTTRPRLTCFLKSQGLLRGAVQVCFNLGYWIVLVQQMSRFSKI